MPNIDLGDGHPRWRRSVGFIAVGAGIAAFSMNFWIPFLPLYMRDLGAETEPRQLFWTALALSSNGVFRMIGGPIWGVLSDRYGRKPMYVRALYAATATTLIAVVATEPWHVAVAMACQGLFSGFIPAAVALTSVSVPQSRLTSALGQVQGAQYAGSTIGPAAGALLAQFLDLRGAILASAIMPCIAATLVLILVPRDKITRRPMIAHTPTSVGWRRAIPRDAGLQFGLGLLLYFMIFTMVDLVRTAAPAAISALEGEGSATGATGVAFTVSGLASVAGALVLSRFVGRPGQFRVSLTVVVAVCALSHIVLGLAPTVLLFITAYGVASLARGAMLPATNTVIAASVPPERRGTAFGIASAVQASAFIVGPMSAALFATVSLSLGFVVLGLVLGVTSIITYAALREPELTSQTPIEEEPQRSPTRAPA
jgi:DHA1 family multidrug resistance protein-like MFS transporter